MALLAGHANANTTETVGTASTVLEARPEASVSVAAEDSLNNHEKKLAARGALLNAKRVAHMKEFQAKYAKDQQVRLQEDIRLLTERGEFMSMFSLMKSQAAEMKRAVDAENARFMSLHGQVWDPKNDKDAATAAGN